MLERFAWNDSILCWIFFSNAVCCYLYRRFIEERILFSWRISWTFALVAGSSFFLLLFHLTNDTWYGPVTPTILFFVFWYYDFIQAMRRFRPRFCRQCGSKMMVSVYDSRVAHLYGEGRLCTRDLWFCAVCLQTARKIQDVPSLSYCGRCHSQTRHSDSFSIIAPPQTDVIGTSAHRSVCERCGTVHRRRVLVRPLIRGSIEDIYPKERELVNRMNRLSTSDE